MDLLWTQIAYGPNGPLVPIGPNVPGPNMDPCQWTQIAWQSMDQYWKKILDLKTRSFEIKSLEVRKWISLIFSLPFSDVPANYLSGILKSIKQTSKIETTMLP